MFPLGTESADHINVAAVLQYVQVCWAWPVSLKFQLYISPHFINIIVELGSAAMYVYVNF